jgi:8-oxo-dGTP pyrophosphatase MutT (NUDIX family)
MLLEILHEYFNIFPGEQTKLATLLEQVSAGDDLQNRKTLPGHITGAAFVLSPDKSKLLLIHHVILQKWLQPGGHWDPGEADPLSAARREAVEETAVQIAKNIQINPDNPLVPLDIDSHYIPANPAKNEPEHYHHDFRYVFMAANEQLKHQAEEVMRADWFGFDAPECEHVRPVIQKMAARGIIQA